MIARLSAPPVVAADDSAPVTPPVVAADDSAPVTPPVVAADDSAPVTPPVVATDDIPPATPPVVAADNVPPAAPAVGAADDGLLADQANAAVGHHGHGSHGWHNDLHFDQMGLSADAAHGFDGGHQLAHMLADIISAHASVAFIQTMQTVEKNISNSDTAQGGHSQAWFDNDLLGNAATSDLAAMMDNAGDHQHQHFENATARQHQHFEHGWG